MDKVLIILPEKQPQIYQFFLEYWIFLLPLILLVYSIYACIYGEDNRKVNVKRFFYTGCIFIYLIFIKTYDISHWCGFGPFNISSEIWSNIVSMIVFTVISIGLENLIISGFVFKEFGLFGAKFVGEESGKNLLKQKEYINILEFSLKSIYDVSCEMYLLFKNNTVIGQIKNNTFDFCGQFSDILKLYYSNKFETVIIQVNSYTQTAESIQKIVDSLFLQCNLNRKDKIPFEIDLLTHGRTANYFTNKSSNFYMITEPIEFIEENTMLMITILSKEDIIVSDLHAIASFFIFFKSQYYNK